MPNVILNAVIEAIGSVSAATLSLPTAQANGASAYTGTVNIDQAGGTLYRLVHLAGQNPDATTIKASGATSTPAQVGTQNLSGSGLTPETTYAVSYCHETIMGQSSNVVRSASFTTGSQGAASGTATINILKRSNGGFDPEAFTFQCTTTGSTQADNAATRTAYDPSFHNLDYIWTFGDTGAASDKVENLPTIWNDLNIAYGKEVSHVYTAPGTYTVTVTVYEQNGTLVGTDSLSVTVAAADSLWTGTDVVLVNAAGQGDPAYPGATIVNSWNAAMTEIGNGNNTKMVLLRRGETYAASAGLQMTGGNAPNVYIGTYGSGARPVVTFSASGSYISSTVFAGFYSSFDENVVLQGIEFVGPWNVEDETGTSLKFADFKQESRETVIVDDCVLRGFAIGVALRVDNGGYNFGLYVNNTHITDWKDYGIFCGDNWNQKIAVLGCLIAQNPQANSGYSGNKGDNFRNTHGPIRCANGGFVHIAGNDLFSRTGWGANRADQPCLRVGTSPQEAVTARYRYNVERNAMEGGFQMILVRNENQSGNYYGGNFLFDKNLLVATAVTWSLFALQYSGVTIRNILGFKPNAPGLSSFPWTSAFAAVGDSPNDMQDNRANFPSQIYASTVVNRLNDANRGSRDLLLQEDLNIPWSAGYVFDNVIGDAPNAAGQGEAGLNLSTAALATVGGTWTTRYLGGKWSAQTTMDGTYATPAGSVDAAIPQAGSSALGTASGVIPYDDFTGAQRGTPADRGAREG